jgi:hypothetical protein
MTLPVVRTNGCTNPGFEVSAANWTAVNGGSVGRNTSFYRTGVASGLITFPTFTGQAGVGNAVTTTVGQSYTVSAWFKTSVAGKVCLQWNGVQSAKHTGSNNWEKLTVTATASATTTQLYAVANDPTSGQSAYVDDVFVELTANADGTSWDGSTTEVGWKYSWTGTAGLSTSTREVSGIWLDGLTDAPGPRVQVTAVDLGGTAVLTQVTRESDGVTWTVPGWKAKNSLTAETWTDWFPPLNRPVTYTLFVNGQAFNSRTIQVDSTVGYIVDPLQPDGALPVDVTDTGVLHLSHAALTSRQLKFRGKLEYPVGGRYPIASAGPRGAASGIDFVINAPSTDLADQLEDLADEAPILLFRPLPSWGRLPGVCYMAGDVAPTFFHRGAGGRFSQWSISGELVAPVTRAAVTGAITNDMVATNLAGRTNTSIANASAWRRHIDIKANPLGLGS